MHFKFIIAFTFPRLKNLSRLVLSSPTSLKYKSLKNIVNIKYLYP